MDKKKEMSMLTIASAPSQTTLNTSSTATLAVKSPDGEYDPFAHRETTSQYSNMGALAHLLKGSLGSGILAMPMAFKNGGLVFGSIGTVVIGIICTHCVHLLVHAAQTLCVRLQIPSLDMSGTAAAAFSSGPAALRPYATIARRFVTTALFCTYYFGLTAYVVLIAASIQQVVDQYAGKPDPQDIDPLSYTRIFIALLVVPLIPLVMIRKLKHLVPFSMVANLCIVVGFGITLYYLVEEIHDPSDRSYGTSLKGLPIFFATVLFAMEGIGTVMPVENTMRNPKRLVGWSGVLTIAMTVVVVLFAGMGFLGYLRYGEKVEGSVTLNLRNEEIPAQIVKLLLAVAILFTYPLQNYVAIGLLWDVVGPRVRTSLQPVAQVVMRVLMVLGTIIVALAVPNLGPIVSLIGALFFSILGLFIPAVVDTATHWKVGAGLTSRRNLYLFTKNGVLVVLSLLSVVAGTYSSVLDIIDAYSDHPVPRSAPSPPSASSGAHERLHVAM